MGDKNYQELDTRVLEYSIDLSSSDSSECDSDTDESIPEFTALKPNDFDPMIEYSTTEKNTTHSSVNIDSQVPKLRIGNVVWCILWQM